jgi:hypothetical protein
MLRRLYCLAKHSGLPGPPVVLDGNAGAAELRNPVYFERRGNIRTINERQQRSQRTCLQDVKKTSWYVSCWFTYSSNITHEHVHAYRYIHRRAFQTQPSRSTVSCLRNSQKKSVLSLPSCRESGKHLICLNFGLSRAPTRSSEELLIRHTSASDTLSILTTRAFSLSAK